MWFSRLLIERLRNLDSVELETGPGLVLLQGLNGAGKSSVLEAMSLLSRGRSFRSGPAGSLIQRGSEELSVFAEVRGSESRFARVGYARSSRSWSARCNGAQVASLAELAQACPVACFEPGAHEWISGPSEGRRRLLDWVVFHVEHGFHREWLRYRQAIAARNQLLKSNGSDAELAAWERVLVESGATIDAMRQEVGSLYCQYVSDWWSRLSPGASALGVSFFRGWGAEQDLAALFLQSRSSDREQGFTRRGPHRADVSLQIEQRAARELVSRGQQKALALCLLLAQIDCVVERSGIFPILLLDDFCSELDVEVQNRVLSNVVGENRQIWLTATSFDLQGLQSLGQPQVFHVEQGSLRQLV